MIDEQSWTFEKSIGLTRDSNNTLMLITESDVTSVKANMTDGISARYNRLEGTLAL